ncbi:3-methyl-2-oxobutanoate hydroxymethyltransferase [Campylobacter sp. MIT 21-1685]|uniref:3-methyl-2-oxobutanoate hydroxymethyltransferase n=1 Tax=unclassified Campylobacter TaxID=2593542 RepID=UPI00224A74B3|nr:MULTISPECIES: 3-methyl-2-oxobutanoate hydroxymethyltransferase [unclassified Campylobacter]MCX2682391.1 3-methyl-2-oxobutanoate hydroxymethyltransferase [Campylobacter sp. MIT 21-1684]MCX2750671.1 3-methyl-2-oxobutanoate hydroxymethyltransferase [Campylobacter sp. MIT 21-1682]MCX2806781.1 3-methyl-2-oxobutanoate hydroxymethyltransferase [Campylobacter sp. MIT 21-1685]
MKKTIISLQKQKEKKEKITMATSYEYSSAKMLDDLDIDMILIGDSLGMVVLGYEDTLSVSMEDMIYHSLAVSRAVKKAFLVADLPFMSYQTSVHSAVENAGRLLKQGRANAVKLEGGSEFAPHIEAISKAFIPVMAHIGLAPQAIHTLGGYKVQGKDEDRALKIIQDAKIAEKSGAFALLLECIPQELAKKITEEVSIPTIGIGAGKYCDGQVLVWHDIIGLNTEFKPKFVKHFLDVSEGIKTYIKEVRSGEFPAQEHSFSMDNRFFEKLYEGK